MKRLSKKVGLICGLSLCAMAVLAGNNITVCASPAAEVETDNEGRAAVLEWVYATIDGQLMMRLYNHATGQWVTDWVPAVGEPD